MSADLALDRLVWRWELGYASADAVRIALADALRRLGDDFAALHGRQAVIRRWSSGLLADREQTVNGARRNLEEGAYRAAANDVHRAQHSSASARSLVAAADRIDQAVAALAQVKAHVPQLRLRQLPTIASLESLIAVARRCMSDGSYGQARLIARLGRDRARQQLVRDVADGHEQSRLERRIAALESVASDTSAFAGDPAEDLPADGTTRTLRRLVAKRQVRLAASLLAELEIVMKPRLRFYRELENFRRDPRSLAALGSTAEFAAAVAARSWPGALDLLWQRAVAAHAQLLASNHSRLGAAAEAMAALTAAAQPASPEPSLSMPPAT